MPGSEVPQSMDNGSWIVRFDFGSGVAALALAIVVVLQWGLIIRLLGMLKDRAHAAPPEPVT